MWQEADCLRMSPPHPAQTSQTHVGVNPLPQLGAAFGGRRKTIRDIVRLWQIVELRGPLCRKYGDGATPLRVTGLSSTRGTFQCAPCECTDGFARQGFRVLPRQRFCCWFRTLKVSPERFQGRVAFLQRLPSTAVPCILQQV